MQTGLVLKSETTTVSSTTASHCDGNDRLTIICAASASDDVKDVDLNKVHNLTGPIAVEGAEPGDCLVVDILDGISFRTDFPICSHLYFFSSVQSSLLKKCLGDIPYETLYSIVKNCWLIF